MTSRRIAQTGTKAADASVSPALSRANSGSDTRRAGAENMFTGHIARLNASR